MPYQSVDDVTILSKSVKSMTSGTQWMDRFERILELCEGKRVLDIGCCGSDATGTVHSRIAQRATTSLGIDLFAAGVENLAGLGLNVRFSDAENFVLQKDEPPFEIAIMGDVVEHISNPGQAFATIQRCLVKNGLFVLTTPNPFSLQILLKRLARKPFTVNSDHVVWYDPLLLQELLGRSGFEVVEIFWVKGSRYRLIRAFQGRYPEFSDTFGIVARKSRD